MYNTLTKIKERPNTVQYLLVYVSCHYTVNIVYSIRLNNIIELKAYLIRVCNTTLCIIQYIRVSQIIDQYIQNNNYKSTEHYFTI